MKKCLCEQAGRVHGTVKSTRLEDLEYDLAHIRSDNRDIHSLYERFDYLLNRLSSLENPPNWETKLKRKIIKWLDFWNN